MQTEGMTEEQKAYVEGLEAALRARSDEVKELKQMLDRVIHQARVAREAGTNLMKRTVEMKALTRLFAFQEEEASRAARELLECYTDKIGEEEEDESDIYSEEE